MYGALPIEKFAGPTCPKAFDELAFPGKIFV